MNTEEQSRLQGKRGEFSVFCVYIKYLQVVYYIWQVSEPHLRLGDTHFKNALRYS